MARGFFHTEVLVCSIHTIATNNRVGASTLTLDTVRRITFPQVLFERIKANIVGVCQQRS